MINNNLVDYIRSQQKAGKTDDEISRLVTVEGNWLPSDAEEVFAHLKVKSLVVADMKSFFVSGFAGFFTLSAVFQALVFLWDQPVGWESIGYFHVPVIILVFLSTRILKAFAKSVFVTLPLLFLIAVGGGVWGAPFLAYIHVAFALCGVAIFAFFRPVFLGKRTGTAITLGIASAVIAITLFTMNVQDVHMADMEGRVQITEDEAAEISTSIRESDPGFFFARTSTSTTYEFSVAQNHDKLLPPVQKLCAEKFISPVKESSCAKASEVFLAWKLDRDLSKVAKDMAAGSQGVEACSLIRDYVEARTCIVNNASFSKDCETLSDGKETGGFDEVGCLSTVAAKLKDTSVCDPIGNRLSFPNGYSMKWRCIRDAAIKARDTLLCETITEKEKLYECRSSVNNARYFFEINNR